MSAPPDALAPPAARPRGLGRWVVYQRERFPLLAHGPLIAAFSSGAVCFSARLREQSGGAPGGPSAASLAVAFASCLLFFFQLRVSDEFKDFEEDSRHRPYRPVPRGLVTLRELGWAALAGMVAQLALALWLAPRLALLLVLVWGYMALMTVEFGLRGWLASRPVTVLWTHMLVMPLIDLYATACDWLAAGAGRAVGLGLVWFLLASFFNGMVVEVGRKIRAPEDEEAGVATYSALWGRARAVRAWLGVMVASALFAVLAARAVGAAAYVGALLAALAALAAVTGRAIVRAPRPGLGKRVELLSGVWTIALYGGVGILPLLLGRP